MIPSEDEHFAVRFERHRPRKDAVVLADRPLSAGGEGGARLLLPEAKPTHERISVIARAAARRELFQETDVASAEHDIIRLESGGKPLHHIRDVAAPSLLSPFVQTAPPDV